MGGDNSFFQPTFDVAAWKSLPVPSHWELHGFAEPQYKKVDEGTGLYRRTFRVPGAWGGQRVYLRFDGVLYGLTAWVNGKLIGEWASSYNAVTFDVTDALLPGDADNVLAVRVTTRSKGWEFDTNDCWALSGIYRDVTLFALPAVHLEDYTARTTLRPEGAAEIQLEVVASASAMVRGRLFAPDGTVTKEFQLTLPPDGRGATSLSISRPQLWTAETPSLYRLEMEVQSGGKVVQHFTDRIGLRQITTEDGVLKLNGRPIKLRGVDHHDIWPDEGRVATEELMRRDLELMREANINFLRTSHYPPHPRLIELCDEMGIYVMCEVPFGFGDKNLTDPSFEGPLFTRARATVMRDKNRPSVIIWSIGNENPVTELGVKTAGYTKELDPTRPVCIPTVGSYFDLNIEKFLALPAFVDVFAPHYPSNKRVLDYPKILQRPIIWTEYAHSLGLAFDSMQVQWELFYNSPRTAGGAVWMFQDQGIRRNATLTGAPPNGAMYVWPDASHYYDTAGTDGADGIVYSDRTPQVDYWQVRKVYAPVRIAERRVKVREGEQEIVLQVENRHDFRDLGGMKLEWSLRANGVETQTGSQPLSAKRREQETVSLKVTLPADCAENINTLELRCVNESGRSIVERVIRLETNGLGVVERLLASLPVAGDLKVEQQDNIARVVHDRFVLSLNRETGTMEISGPDGSLLVSGFLPHIGRKFTLGEELRLARAKKDATESDLRSGKSSIWQGSCLRPAAVQSAEITQTADGARVVVRGKYLRPDVPEQSLAGEVTLLISRKGSIEVSYDFTPVNAGGTFLEAGLSVTAPQTAAEFRWLGAGPFAGYPGKDVLNEFGTYHLTSADIRFQGNRREVDLALLTSRAGTGALLAGANMDIAVENSADGIIFSHNALLAGRGNKGGEPEASLKADDIMRIAGKFTLLPLSADWPAPLQSWFGAPGQAATPQKPFYRSYDQ
ncbi:MAG: glycoside hydrolase family 2 TIM barrel-domain containing protein [Lacunisphaera sp.]|nr:glycoside hydrolase family 2 TIM barrel-domain containing protein [Lacunisphaera sp.]